VTPSEREELKGRVRSRTLRADDVRRTSLVLLLADGESYTAIAAKLGCNRNYVSRWKERFKEDVVRGLYGRQPGRKRSVLTPAMEARIMKWTSRNTNGATHWTTRKLGRMLRISHTLVATAWKQANLKVRRGNATWLPTSRISTKEAADVMGLYVNSPQHAAVFCVDVTTAIQALDRLDPVLPSSPGRLERHGFEYYRHGALSLYAALDTKSGEVIGKTVARHTSEEFVAFLLSVVASQPKGREIHIILDNLFAHKTQWVKQFLNDYPNGAFHYTPTYSSWLNQVEIWFTKVERDVIARGVFTSISDLGRKLINYITNYNNAPPPDPLELRRRRETRHWHQTIIYTPLATSRRA
jgi:transposase